MLDIKTLLPELKKLVTDLSEDLLARSTAKNDPYSAKVDTGLREAYAQIEKGGRTADAFEVWREDYLDQVAVAWVLGCVFVRFMEDNHLIDECWLAGEGERRKLAEDTHELYFRAHPHDSDREYFEHVFHEVGKIPACRDLFAEGKTPLWAVGPSGDMAMKLLAFWRDVIPETGELQRSFEVEDGDTRFLGDLYQDLSERARKKYALLQTPVFVEEFILDRTLNPAIDEFGLDEVRMIDPTCGSGHFLLGSFARLFDLWIKREDNEVVAAQKALDGVWGCDINPFAVAIARFRLIVAALRACGIKRLKDAPAWNIHLATGDSLLFGNRWDREGKKKGEQQFLGTAEESWAPEIYACEDKEALSEVLGQQYHAVVGNPPYITAKDKAANAAYRQRYRSAFKKYHLSTPFTERFFELALRSLHPQNTPGYVGLITDNAFMKRDFGKILIAEIVPHIELTYVIDSSGAYIPGHGTPTVILFGRNRNPVATTVRAVLGIQGEPTTPDDPARGVVWQSILKNIDRAESDPDDKFTSSSDVTRSTFNSHPWSLGGGGAAELMVSLRERITTTLGDCTSVIGVFGMTNADEVYLADSKSFQRQGVEANLIKPLQLGDEIRDWCVDTETFAIFPYDGEGNLLSLDTKSAAYKWLWPTRTTLGSRATFNKMTYFEEGLPWWKWHQVALERLQTPLSIVFAFVASHNHFVLDRGGRVFKQSAPIIKLATDADEKQHMELLGFLNSSLACFLMKQVSHQKQLVGGDGVRVQSRAKVPYEFAATQLKTVPVPNRSENSELWNRVERLARDLDRCAAQFESLTAERAISSSLESQKGEIKERVAESSKQKALVRSQMIMLQEELDFTVYCMFGLCDEKVLYDGKEVPVVDAGMRPFEIKQGRNVDDFSVPDGVPQDWQNTLRDLWLSRAKAIESSRELQIIEDDHYKRRWIGRQGLFNLTARQNELETACRSWLLDRLECPSYWAREESGRCTLKSVSALADVARGDALFLQVGAALRGRDDFDVGVLVRELVEGDSVPYLPVLRYKASGLRKRMLWEATWESQRQEDRDGTLGTAKAPPSYTAADFIKTDFMRLRGPLDVPKERWISFPHCETESDPSLVVGWAGWNHLQQATALIAYYDARKREGWDAKRLTPLLAGLDQLLPWIHQWHPEIDPEFGETAGQSFETMLKADAHELGLTLEDIRAWEPPKKTTTRRKRKA